MLQMKKTLAVIFAWVFVAIIYMNLKIYSVTIAETKKRHLAAKIFVSDVVKTVEAPLHQDVNTISAPPQNITPFKNLPDTSSLSPNVMTPSPPLPKAVKTVNVVPHNQRFSRYLHNTSPVSLETPPQNHILEEISWRHKLSGVNICNASEPFILAVVPSSVKNVDRRQAIRDTWGNPKYYSETRMRVIFVLGAIKQEAVQHNVDEEVTLHKDIIQSNIIDSYRNLTYKTVSWLLWARINCPGVSFVAKVDDDVFVNPFHLRVFLEKQMKLYEDHAMQSDNPVPNNPYGNTSPTDLIMGRLEPRSFPHRQGRWEVKMAEYNENRYPPFTLGPAYIIGGSAVKRLLKYVPHTPFLWLEDVFLTGLVASAAGVQHLMVYRELYLGNTNSITFKTEVDKRIRSDLWNKVLMRRNQNP